MTYTFDKFPYEANVESVKDGSPAMWLRFTDKTIDLVNEDGYEWTDPRDQWRFLIREECGFCQSSDCDGECEEVDAYSDYDPSWDYPEYDPQTSFYEATGRLAFPNEY